METTPAVVQPTIPSKISEFNETLNVVLPRLAKGREIGLSYTKDIKKVTKETRQQVIDAMANNRKASEKLTEIRMTVTKIIDEVKGALMLPEKEVIADFDRLKKELESYDAIELEIKRKAEAKAARELEITKYKALIKEKVGMQVVEMVGGQVRIIIEGMSRWEAGLTLANIDGKAEELRKKTLQLGRDKYDLCFKLDFTGKRPDLVSDEDFAKFMMEDLKKEFSYEKANEDYLQQASPIINEYRAKIPSIKEALASVKTVDAEEARKKAIADKAWEDLQTNQKATEAAVEVVAQTKDKEIMEGEFVRQGTLEGMEIGPVERIASFDDIDNNKWIKPFLEVVAKCAVHPKFKLVKAKKAEYIDAVQWFMDFYGKNFQDTLNGIHMKEKPKSIVRASKEDF